MANKEVTFTTTAGSFDSASATSTKKAVTDAQGNVRVTFYDANSSASGALISAKAEDAESKAIVSIVTVASIVWVDNPATKPSNT